MSAKKSAKSKSATPEELREKWLGELNELFKDAERWVYGLDWSSRRIEKKMEDPQIGKYQAPALLLQKETTRVLMEPIARSSPGNEGLVDLYLLPAYDDIASLYHYAGQWHVHYYFPGDPTLSNIRDTPSRPLNQETFLKVLDEMVNNAT